MKKMGHFHKFPVYPCNVQDMSARQSVTLFRQHGGHDMYPHMVQWFKAIEMNQAGFKTHSHSINYRKARPSCKLQNDVVVCFTQHGGHDI